MTRTFDFNWKVAVFSAVFFTIFVYLGFWQLNRAGEKISLLESMEEAASRPPVSWEQIDKRSVAYAGLTVAISGEYDTGRMLLLDNRVLDGKVGFEVLVPFQAASGEWLLINRGFVPMGRTRDDVPMIPVIEPSGSLTGTVYIPQGAEFSLQTDEPDAPTAWPRIVQSADPSAAQVILGEALFPHIVRLASSDPNALPRFWPTTVTLPGRHQGYAVQWFAMAMTIAMAFLVFSFRKTK